MTLIETRVEEKNNVENLYFSVEGERERRMIIKKYKGERIKINMFVKSVPVKPNTNL